MPDLLLHSIAWLFGYREVPVGSRSIFRNEFKHILCWGVVWGCLHGGFCGYVALSSFQASDLVVSIIAAAMAFANLFAVYWAALAQRGSKRRLMIILLNIITALLLSFLLTPLCDTIRIGTLPRWLVRITSPSQPLTTLVFTVQIVLLWIALQAVNTVRTSIWKNNYPDAYRGRILARFAIWQILIGAAWVAMMGAYFDGEFRLRLFGREMLYVDLSWLYGAGQASAYSRLFPLAAVASILSVMYFKKIRVRGDHDHAAYPPVSDRAGTETVETHYETPGWFVTRWGVLRSGLRDARRILELDARFRQYMRWMFLSGSCIMMIQVPLVLILKQVFDISYLQAAGLLTFVPQVVIVLCTPLWARLFDRWQLFFFRSVQVSIWVVSRLLLALAVYRLSMPLLIAAVAVAGVALAGGRFAWHLGHMGFSNKANDSTYLGIHLTLTGLRGLTMPFLGAVLYRHVLGWHIIWISAVLLAFAAAGYYRMHRAE